MQTSTLRGISIVLLIIFGTLYFYTGQQKEYYEKTALPAISGILKEISQWEKNGLLAYLAPEAKQTITEDNLARLLNHYRQFGAFKSVGELQFSRLASALSLFGQRRVSYSGIAQFENGPVNLTITLNQTGNGFLIYNLSLTEATM